MPAPSVSVLNSALKGLLNTGVNLDQKLILNAASGTTVSAAIAPRNRQMGSSGPSLNHAQALGAAGVRFQDLTKPCPKYGEVPKVAFTFGGIVRGEKGGREHALKNESVAAKRVFDKEPSSRLNRSLRAAFGGGKDGEIALFDKAYINFRHLFNLHQRGVFCVTRAKDNMSYRVRKKLQHKRKPGSKIIRDDLVILTTAKSKEQYPEKLRRVEMLVEIDGKEVVMVFITNNTKWAATSVGALYQARWGIEVFFKQIKQTLKVCDFLGHSKHAIRWQLWSALLVYILLRYQSQLVGWSHSFIRLFAMVRGVTWSLLDLNLLLKSYGTASGSYRYRARPETLYLPGFTPPGYRTA